MEYLQMIHKYFVDIAPKLASKITGSCNPMDYVTVSSNSIYIPYVTESEV